MAKRPSRKSTKKIILDLLNKSSKDRPGLENSFKETNETNFMAVCKTEDRELTGWTTKKIADSEADDHQLNTFHEVSVLVR